MAQARLLHAALLLLAVGQLSDAAPTEAEVFWRTVLPDSPLPEAILKLLHSAGTSSVNKPKETDADGFSFSRGPFYYRRYGAHKHSSRRTSGGDSTLSRSPFLYNYSPHEQPSLKPSGRGDSTRWLSRSPFLYYYSRPHKRSSLTPSDGDSTGWLLKFFISYASPEHSLPRPSGDDAMEEPLRWLFFHEQAVQVGKNMTLFFPQAATAPLGLLPRHVADSIPFSTASLSGVLARFGIAMGSVQAASMEETLHMCELPPAAAEAKFCATSLEALVEDAMAALGTRNIRPVTSDLPPSGAPLQTYTIRGVRPVDGSSFVSCHDDNYYPYTVYTCHDTGSTRAYMVEMEGARTGVVVTVAAICHTDTSHWDPEHVSFKLLGTKPGGTPVCHYLPYGHMIWVSMANHSSS